MKGLFITIEGPDGAGKTSVIESLVPKLRDLVQCDIVETREPGGIRIAEEIRKIILDPNNTMMDDRTEALLYAAARRQHFVEKIKPSLDAGKMVICDRFVDSSLAYQGRARGIGIEEVLIINDFAVEGTVPDLTIYIDIDAETGMQRVHQSSPMIDRLESNGLEFQQRVRHAYLDLWKENQHRIFKVDGKQNLDIVVQDCFEIIKNRYPNMFVHRRF